MLEDSSDILISVALVTRNRPESLERCLKSLRLQNIQPFEVVVSDDSDPEFAAETETIAKRWDCRYVSGPRQGLYANRNSVALLCKGTHIRTMDDDHEFPDRHFEKCLLATKSDPDAIWIFGEYSPSELSETPRFEPYRCPGQMNAKGYSANPQDTQNCWAIADGASIYPRQIFDSGIKYAEYFKFGAAYLEIGSRLHWLKYRIRHLDSTYIIHHCDLSNRSVMVKSIDLSSRIFAILCHSFIYQPSLQNKSITILELCKILVTEKTLFFQSLKSAMDAFKQHSKQIAVIHGKI